MESDNFGFQWMVFSMKVKNSTGSAQIVAGLEERGKMQKWDVSIFGLKVVLKLYTWRGFSGRVQRNGKGRGLSPGEERRGSVQEKEQSERQAASGAETAGRWAAESVNKGHWEQK